MKKAYQITGAAVVMLALAGCDTSQGLGRLFATNPHAQTGPDEFGIVPTKPLETPPNFTELPTPNPNARNRVDREPDKDAVAALGGRPERLDSPNLQAGEGALLAAAQRRTGGSGTNIREVLADEDAKLRDRRGPQLLERWFGTDTYFRTYDGDTLRARGTAENLRRRGVRVPAAPPPGEE